MGVGKAKGKGAETRPERGVEARWLATGGSCLKHLGILTEHRLGPSYAYSRYPLNSLLLSCHSCGDSPNLGK